MADYITGPGFGVHSNPWDDVEDENTSVSENNRFINCDAHYLADMFWYPLPGMHGIGFTVARTSLANNTTFDGCRAWNYSYAGFDFTFSENNSIVINSSWAFSSESGSGFNVGPAESNQQNNHLFTITRSIVADNYAGFTSNSLANVSAIHFFNNFAYQNEFGWLFYETGINAANILKNNIGFSNTNASFYCYNNSDSGSSCTTALSFNDSYNSWNISNVTVDASDFESLDVAQLMSPRQADGSLPNVSFGKLLQGSDLVDAGIAIPGFNNESYQGLAPDLGPFESVYSTEETCFDGVQNQDELAVDCGGVCGDCFTWNSYFCAFHNIHTEYSDGVMTINESANETLNNYDCGSTNDHDVWPSNLTETEWTNTINISNEYNDDGNFTYFFGIEWSGSQHIHYITMSPPATPKYVSDADFDTVAELAAWLAENQGLAHINHPARRSGNTDFSNPEQYNETWIPLVEIKNIDEYHWNYYWNCSIGSGCTTYTNPNIPGDQIPGTSYWIKYALDNGIHLGFTCGNDYHGSVPLTKYCYTGVANATNLTRQGIYDALKSRHTWVGEEETIMEVSAFNGSETFIMGDIFSINESSITINYTINASTGNNISNVNLFFNGVIVNVTNYDAPTIRGSITWPLTGGGTEDYVFIEVNQSNSKYAWSSPLWVTAP